MLFRSVAPGNLFMKKNVFLAKVHGGAETEREVFVQFHLTQYTYTESRVVIVNIGIPLFTGLRVCITGVGQLHVLNVQSQQEAIMELPFVYIGTELQFSGLCHSMAAAQADKQHTQGKEEYNALHTLYKRNRPLFYCVWRRVW